MDDFEDDFSSIVDLVKAELEADNITLKAGGQFRVTER